MTRTSCTPPATAVAATALPREKRKYHSTQTMATAPSAVTAIWVEVMRPPLPLADPSLRGRRLDAHGVEGAPHERQRDHEERAGEHQAQRGAALGGQRNRQLHRQQTEQGGELDDRIHRD